MALLRSPAVLVGLLLTIIGLGNVYTGYSKTAEYEELLARRAHSRVEQTRADSDQRATRRSLLTTFEREQVPSAAARSKLDFYRVVHTGGRILTLVGIFSIVGGIAVTWHRRGAVRLADVARTP